MVPPHTHGTHLGNKHMRGATYQQQPHAQQFPHSLGRVRGRGQQQGGATGLSVGGGQQQFGTGVSVGRGGESEEEEGGFVMGHEQGPYAHGMQWELQGFGRERVEDSGVSAHVPGDPAQRSKQF